MEKLRRTRIICTLGPSASDENTIHQLIEAGMDIARLNMSHRKDNFKSEQNLIKIIRKSQKRVLIALDTRGPEIRTMEIPEKGIEIKKGDNISFFSNTTKQQSNIQVKLNYDVRKLKNLKNGFVFNLDDSLLFISIIEFCDDCIIGEAMNSHILHNRKSVNFPGIDLKMPFISEKDKEDIIFGLRNSIDMIFVSFVSEAEDIMQLKKFMSQNIKKKENFPLIIAKIESQRGIKNLDEIMDVSDGIMIARGDLGCEFPLHHIFSLQKYISGKCILNNKPFIVATQMMESMISCIVPTRAEITDIGNAIIDGCYAVMLSGETANGKYPIECVKKMNRICLSAEVFEDNLLNIKDDIMCNTIPSKSNFSELSNLPEEIIEYTYLDSNDSSFQDLYTNQSIQNTAIDRCARNEINIKSDQNISNNIIQRLEKDDIMNSSYEINNKIEIKEQTDNFFIKKMDFGLSFENDILGKKILLTLLKPFSLDKEIESIIFLGKNLFFIEEFYMKNKSLIIVHERKDFLGRLLIRKNVFEFFNRDKETDLLKILRKINQYFKVSLKNFLIIKHEDDCLQFQKVSLN